MGVFKKIKEGLFAYKKSRARAEALAQRLLDLGLKAELIDQRRWIKRSLGGSGWTYDHIIKLAGQRSIDGVFLAAHSGGAFSEADFSTYVHYVLFGMKWPQARTLEAKTKEVKEHWYGGKIRSVKWVGGQLAQVLNSDVDLLQLQVQEGQTKIEIIPDEKSRWLHIVVCPPTPDVWDPVFLSRDSFNIYDRIAKHARNYLEQITK